MANWSHLSDLMPKGCGRWPRGKKSPRGLGGAGEVDLRMPALFRGTGHLRGTDRTEENEMDRRQDRKRSRPCRRASQEECIRNSKRMGRGEMV